MKQLVVAFRRLARLEAGVTSLEYALLAALIGGVIIGAVGTIGPLMDDKFITLAESFNWKDGPAAPHRPPPGLVITTLGNDAGGTPGDTREFTPTEGGAGGSVTISAAALLAAARGSSLNAKPAAGPAGGTQTFEATEKVAAASRGGGGRSPQSSGSRDAGSPIGEPDSFKVNSFKVIAVDGEATPSEKISKGGASGNNSKSRNHPNFLSGSEGWVLGLLALLAVLLGLALTRKIVKRATVYSDRKSQLREWQKRRGPNQINDSVEVLSDEVGANP